MGLRDSVAKALGPDIVNVISDAFSQTPQGELFQMGRAIRQQQTANRMPAPFAPSKKPFQQLTPKQQEVAGHFANLRKAQEESRIRSTFLTGSPVPTPAPAEPSRFRGTLTEPRTPTLSSAEIQQRARTGAAEQRARLGLPQGPTPLLSPSTPLEKKSFEELSPKQQEASKAAELARASRTPNLVAPFQRRGPVDRSWAKPVSVQPPATTAETAQQAPSAVAPAGTRTNKRKSNRGIGSYGQSLINLDLPK